MAVELEFRDGGHAVADHVAAMLRNVETHTLTMEEAIRASEKQMLRDHLNGVQSKLVAAHFRENRR